MKKGNRQRSNRCALLSFRVVCAHRWLHRTESPISSRTSSRLLWLDNVHNNTDASRQIGRRQKIRPLVFWRTHTPSNVQESNDTTKWKKSFIVRWCFTLSVSILERNDHRRHEHDSLHVYGVIHGGIYAENQRRTRANRIVRMETDQVRPPTFRSRGIRPSLSSFARAARRFKMRLYCLALTYSGSSSVGSAALAAWLDADEDAPADVKPPVCIWTACSWPEFPGTILKRERENRVV